MTASAAAITSFTLVNADTERDLFALTPGMVLNLATLPTRHLNVRANTDAAPVGSVVFQLTGAQNHSETQNTTPYSLFSDFNGDYYNWTPPLGSYTLLATPYTGPNGPNGTGTDVGTSLTINFSVINDAGAVTSLTLVNAETDRDLFDLTPGMVLDLGRLPTRKLNVRANSSIPNVASVLLRLAGAQTVSHPENTAPFALFSDLSGDYDPWTPPLGNYSLTAIPYDEQYGGGSPGTELTIAFSVIDSGPPLGVHLTAFAAEAQATGAVLLRWSTASEENNLEFIVQRSSDGKTFTQLASVPGHGTTSAPKDYRFVDEQLLPNTTTLYYRLRQVDVDGTATFSPVRTVKVGTRAASLQVYSALIPDGLIHYTFSGAVSGTEPLELYTMLGERRGQYPVAASGTGAVPVAGLSAGIYVLRVVTSTGRYATRFVVP